jgi:hypothetical protein
VGISRVAATPLRHESSFMRPPNELRFSCRAAAAA